MAEVDKSERWVLTGAAGTIGSSLRPWLAEQVAELRLVDVAKLTAAHPRETVRVADIRDQEAIAGACAGVDGIVHLAGIPVEDDFAALDAVNIAGTHHVLEAARRTGARRVVLASSNHVTGMYPVGAPVDPEMPVAPDSLYGVSKVAGEALGRMYADKFGLGVTALRIGSFQPVPRDERQLSTWLSPRDCLAAVLAAMAAPVPGFVACYGVSRNTRRWWDLAAGEAIGFDPRDDAELHQEAVPADSAQYRFQGGPFADPEYTLRQQV